MVFVDLVGPFTISTVSKTHSLLALSMIDPDIITGWFEIVEDTNKSAASIQYFFIIPGWHVTRDLNLLSLTNRGEFNRDFKQMCVQDNNGIEELK
jgi:hypothetical protein